MSRNNLQTNWKPDEETLPGHEDVHVRLCLPQKQKSTILSQLFVEESSSKKRAKKNFTFKRLSPTKLSTTDFYPYQVGLTDALQLDVNNGIEEQVRERKEEERQKLMEEKRKYDEELKLQQDAQAELLRQLDAIKGKQFTFDQHGNVILQDMINFNSLPSPLNSVRLTGESETVKVSNKFQKFEKPIQITKLKNQTVKDMMNQLPIVIAKPQPVPAGSFFDMMNPSLGVKMQEGKKQKEQEDTYEQVMGKTSRAAYLDNKEKQGIFQSSMKDLAIFKTSSQMKEHQSNKKFENELMDKLGVRADMEQSSIALDIKKSQGRIYFKKPQALNDLVINPSNSNKGFNLKTILSNTKQISHMDSHIIQGKSQEGSKILKKVKNGSQTVRIVDEEQTIATHVNSNFLKSLKSNQMQTLQNMKMKSSFKPSTGYSTQRDNLSEKKSAFFVEQNTIDPQQLTTELNQMIINNDKWGTPSGQTQIQSALNLNLIRPQTRQKSQQENRRLLQSRESGRENLKSGFMTKRIKKSVPKLNFDSLLRTQDQAYYSNQSSNHNKQEQTKTFQNTLRPNSNHFEDLRSLNEMSSRQTDRKEIYKLNIQRL